MTEQKCVNPSEIQQGDLIAYLHGDAPPRIAAHIARCPFCSRQVEQLRMVDAQLLAAFYREACPTPEVLADFVLRRLPDTERLRVAAHVRTCAACAAEVASVRELTDQAPPSLLTRLRESLALALTARPVTQVPRPARGQGWQGRFEIDDWIITLSSGANRLTGRVRRRGAPPDIDLTGQAWLLHPVLDTVADIPRSPVDARGYLAFTGLAAGVYDLLLQIGGQDVALEAVEVA